MSEFKQIIGRGTRVRDDYGKLWFNIIDYTGSATRLFADPSFDGEPARITVEELKRGGATRTIEIVEPPIEDGEVEPKEILPPEGGWPISEPPPVDRKKYYFDGGRVEVAAHLVYELDADGNQLRVIRYTEYAAEKVRTLCRSPRELRERWEDPVQRAEIIERLAERGVDFIALADAAHQPEADPFDLLCHLAFNAPLRTRRERAQRLREERPAFFDRYGAEARQILDELLEKYADHGTAQFLLPDILRVPPLSDHGTVLQIADAFGGSDQLRNAVHELQNLLYAA